MSDSLSQDELDALLGDIGGSEDPSGSDSMSSGGGSSSGGGDLSKAEQGIAETIAESLKSGGSNLGVMLGGEATVDHVSNETVTGDDIQDRFGDQTVVLYTELSGPVNDSIGLCFSRQDAASLAARATGADADSVEFSQDDLDSLNEIVGPVLIGIARSLSGKAGSQIQTSPIQSVLIQNGKNFPIEISDAVLMQAPLSMEGVMDNDISLVVPRSLIQAVANKSSETESSPGATNLPSGGKAAETKKMSGAGQNLNLLLDVQMPLTVELGRTRMYVKEVLTMGEGSIIELDKLAGEPVDLMVNGKLIAKGEVVVIDENFGVRVTDIVSPNERMKFTK